MIFENFFVPSSRAPVPREMLTLNSGTNAIDSGEVLPNLADIYVGDGPDLGAYEIGQQLPHYGPRTGQVLVEHEFYWAWH